MFSLVLEALNAFEFEYALNKRILAAVVLSAEWKRDAGSHIPRIEMWVLAVNAKNSVPILYRWTEDEDYGVFR